MPTFHLVVDEVVPVANHRFRVRVWRRADAQPIELLSQARGWTIDRCVSDCLHAETAERRVSGNRNHTSLVRGRHSLQASGADGQETHGWKRSWRRVKNGWRNGRSFQLSETAEVVGQAEEMGTGC